MIQVRLRAWGFHHPTTTSAEGEARAALMAVWLARDIKTKHLHLKGDAQDIVEDLLGWEDPQRAEIGNNFHQTHELLASFESGGINFRLGCGNFLVHNIAKRAVSYHFEGSIPSSLFPPLGCHWRTRRINRRCLSFVISYCNEINLQPKKKKPIQIGLVNKDMQCKYKIMDRTWPTGHMEKQSMQCQLKRMISWRYPYPFEPGGPPAFFPDDTACYYSVEYFCIFGSLFISSRTKLPINIVSWILKSHRTMHKPRGVEFVLQAIIQLT